MTTHWSCSLCMMESHTCRQVELYVMYSSIKQVSSLHRQSAVYLKSCVTCSGIFAGKESTTLSTAAHRPLQCLNRFSSYRCLARGCTTGDPDEERLVPMAPLGPRQRTERCATV